MQFVVIPASNYEGFFFFLLLLLWALVLSKLPKRIPFILVVVYILQEIIGMFYNPLPEMLLLSLYSLELISAHTVRVFFQLQAQVLSPLSKQFLYPHTQFFYGSPNPQSSFIHLRNSFSVFCAKHYVKCQGYDSKHRS